MILTFRAVCNMFRASSSFHCKVPSNRFKGGRHLNNSIIADYYCFHFSEHSFHIHNFPILFAIHQTEDLLINYICVLSVYPILTFLYLLFTLYVVSYMVSINFSMLNLKRFPYSPKEKYAKYKFKNTVFCT